MCILQSTVQIKLIWTEVPWSYGHNAKSMVSVVAFSLNVAKVIKNTQIINICLLCL